MSRFFATAGVRGSGGRNGAKVILLAAGTLLLFSAASMLGGCYEHTRGNPVDRYHYKHFISVAADQSTMSIQTYIARTQWEVGFRREDLYDGNRDGELTTLGLDRVIITDYVDVEDPPESAVRRSGELRDYDSLFQSVIKAMNRSEKSYRIDERTYEFRILSENLAADSGQALG